MIKSTVIGISAAFVVAAGTAIVVARADITAVAAGVSPISSSPVPSMPRVSPPSSEPVETSAPAPAASTSSAAPNRQAAAPESKRFTRARLTVPAAGIDGLEVVSYRGTPDDRAGTQIQNRGIAAAPYGSWGGVNPGEVGNLIITAHRTSHGQPMGQVPDLTKGDLIKVSVGGKTYTYKVSHELWVNFRNETSRNSQRLPAPGQPGVAATRPAIVLSTCATPEDAARGDYWRDELGNPTHRIAVVGYLV